MAKEAKPLDGTWFTRGVPEKVYDPKKSGYVYTDAELNKTLGFQDQHPTDEETAE